MSKFQRWLTSAKVHRWSVLQILTLSGIHKFLSQNDINNVSGCTFFQLATYLQKHFAKHSICLILESGVEYDGDSVLACLDVDCFIFAIVHSHQLWIRVCLLLILKLFLFFECAFEWCSQNVSLDQGYFSNNGVSSIYRLC
jgi:hypothetical protein